MQLLKQLYVIHSETGREWPMIQLVREYVSKNIPEATIRFDKLGNLYITKGEAGIGYPTLACHLDQVQKIHSEDFEVRQDGDILYGWSEQSQQRGGLFGPIGDAISGTFDRVFKVADVAGALTTDKLGLQDYVEKVEFGDM